MKRLVKLSKRLAGLLLSMSLVVCSMPMSSFADYMAEEGIKEVSAEEKGEHSSLIEEIMSHQESESKKTENVISENMLTEDISSDTLIEDDIIEESVENEKEVVIADSENLEDAKDIEVEEEELELNGGNAEPDYLTFTAGNGTMEIGVGLCSTGSPDKIALQYSTSSDTWKEYPVKDSNNPKMITLQPGESVSFRASGSNANFSKSAAAYYSFVTSGGNNYIEASGNIMSLLDENCTRTSVPQGAFANLFSSASIGNQLKKAPKLPAETVGTMSYLQMFKGCENLEEAPELPATSLSKSSYTGMFYGCTLLKKAPALPATTLSSSCYASMFSGCESLTEAPALPATTLSISCYSSMFSGCESLTEAPELKATELKDNCYKSMFDSCTSLVVASTSNPNIKNKIFTCPSTSAQNSVSGMFNNTGGPLKGVDPQTGITYYTVTPDYLTFTAEEANAEVELSWINSEGSFVQISTRTNGGEWSAFGEKEYSGNIMTTLEKKGDQVRFRGMNVCTSEEFHFSFSKRVEGSGSVTSLLDGNGGDKNVTLKNECCFYMFKNCDSLTKAPKLPALKLATMCYYRMFYGCTTLSDVPELPATELADACYQGMFECCDNIKLSKTKTGNYTKSWKIPADVATASGWNYMMFSETGGTYTGGINTEPEQRDDPVPGTTYYVYVSSQSSNTSSSGKSSSSGSDGIKTPRNTGTGNWNQPTTGTWTKTKDGKWNFGNTEIKTFKKVWGYIYNKKAKKNEPQAHWYYFDENGTMLTGWQTIQGQVYYFSEKDDASLGRMLTGWQKINHKWYYFNETRTSKGGRMLKDTTTPDGYKVGVDGVWIQ